MSHRLHLSPASAPHVTLAPTPRYSVPTGVAPRLHCAGCGQSYVRFVRTSPDVHVDNGVGLALTSWHRRCYDAARTANTVSL